MYKFLSFVVILSIFPFHALTESDFPYFVQIGTPVALPNFAQPDFGCNWLGVGGQVFDASGTPVDGMILELRGTLDGGEILRYAISGGSNTFGPGGYEIEILDYPVASEGEITLKVLDVVGRQVSESIPLQTFGDCNRNLTLLNFTELYFTNTFYLPVIVKN